MILSSPPYFPREACGSKVAQSCCLGIIFPLTTQAGRISLVNSMLAPQKSRPSSKSVRMHGARAVPLFLQMTGLLAAAAAQASAETLISQLNGFNFWNASAAGWSFKFTTSTALSSLPSLSSMNSTAATVDGSPGFEAAPGSWCYLAPREGAVTFHANTLACGASSFGLCSPVAFYSIPSGVNITRVRLAILDGKYQQGSDGVELVLYLDSSRRLQRAVPPIDASELTFGPAGAPGSYATSSIAVRLLPNVTCDFDATSIQIDLFGTGKPQPSPSASPQPGACTSTTLAGTGTRMTAGDGGPATEAAVATPSALAYTLQGDLLIASELGHVVRIVYASNGSIATFAGNGVLGYSGDGGPAAEAQLNTPSGLAVLANGSVLIADSRNHVIRIVSPSGGIDTYAGNGSAVHGGDGLHRRAPSVAFDAPWKLSVDEGGDVIVTCASKPGAAGGGAVRIISGSGSDGTVMTAVAPPGSGLSPQVTLPLQAPHDTVQLPSAVAPRMYVLTDAAGQCVWLINATSNTATAILGNGTEGYSPDGTPLSGSGSGSGSSAVTALTQLRNPAGIAFHAASQHLILAEFGSHALRAFPFPYAAGSSGVLSTVAGNGLATGPLGDGGPALAALLSGPSGLVWHPSSGALLVADVLANVVRSFSPGCMPTPLPVSSGIAACLIMAHVALLKPHSLFFPLVALSLRVLLLLLLFLPTVCSRPALQHRPHPRPPLPRVPPPARPPLPQYPRPSPCLAPSW